ncbi:oxidoreductase [Sphingomonas koreensis]|jgi:naphthalene 1,2-dioxygenase ferredoxin reductase component|uniref:Oxidoreductase n=1 Tax=Sphingomonas koreensis TaxID=93064 RepID=A0A1L6JB34_9SPHN|nr:2Fe-2S iron-sulfur cluster-binding protein [Sphingomonas koreensis]APR53141.1 oxidoreductase [Sphingomonas koreensis]RSU24733.1 oxidoreductase [Sphingomonas koreensis]RSU24961.1 oxidoreductase [Sphingomonas koreensis]RSU26996.1 oxidoreductase [Sphingomonas koreensis]RSU31500.1 oxidoreductase [Sphingomonas koreensis]
MTGTSTTRSIDIRQAGRTIAVGDRQTILDAALDAAIAYPHGCRSGRCGGCKSRLVAGEVEMLPYTRFALTAEERAQGLILACRALPQANAQVAWLGEGEEGTGHTVRSVKAEVIAIDDATHDIKRVLLRIKGEPLAFTAGQYAQLSIAGAPTRDYSMANVPGGSELEFHIRRVPGGKTSERVATHLAVGDTVGLRGPFGSACLRECHTGPILAVAGGSGLAPVKAIVETALANGLRQPIHLYFGVRRRADLYLVDHFEHIAAAHSSLRFVPVLSHETGVGATRTGLVTDAIAADLPDFKGWKAYMAGPPAMIEAAGALVQARGLASGDIHADIFFTPAPILREGLLEASGDLTSCVSGKP